MNLFLEMMIYIVAIIGIIFTTMTFCEINFTKRRFESIYEIICNNSNFEKKVKLKVATENLDRYEIIKLKEILENGNYTNIKEVIDEIEYENDN